MKILCNGAKNAILNEILPSYPHYADYIGWFNTPMSCYSFQRLKDTGLLIACDNGCFNGLNVKRFNSMLMKAEKSNATIQWVAVPDVVGDAQETHNLFQEWNTSIQFPLAYVLQDGVENVEIPFDDIVCLFIGGTTEFKLSKTARDVVRTGQRLGKWIHMGRVNTDKRLKYAMLIGVDSVDGTGYLRYRSRELLPALHLIHKEVCLQPKLSF